MLDCVHIHGESFNEYHKENRFSVGKKTRGLFDNYPFYNNNDFFIAVCGYISNLNELIIKLNAAHLPDQGNPTGMIRQLFEHHVASLFSMLNGVFLLVIYDYTSKTLYVVPDRLGYKKTYYARHSGLIAFSNDFDAIAKGFLPSCEVNYSAIYDIINFNSIIGNATVVKEVELLPLGFYLEICNDDFHLKQFWEFPYALELYEISETELERKLCTKIGSVFNRLHALIKDCDDLYIPLSGGLDSRLCAGMLKKLGKDFKALNAGTPGFLETEISRSLAKTLSVDWKLFDFWAYDYDELEKKWDKYCNGNCLLFYFVRFSPLFYFISSNSYHSAAIDGLGFDILLRGIFLITDNEQSREQFYQSIRRNFAFSSANINKILYTSEFSKAAEDRVLGSLDDFFTASNAANWYEASREFYFKARSRRLVSSGNAFWESFADFIYPGIDSELFDFAVRIPPEFLKTGYIYRKVIDQLLPNLSHIKWEKTNKRIKSYPLPIETSLKNFSKKIENRILKMSNGRLDTFTGKVSYDRYFRNNKNFYQWNMAKIDDVRLKERGIYHIEGLQSIIEKCLSGHNYYKYISMVISLEKIFNKYFD